MDSECIEERIALIADGCNVGQDQARIIYDQLIASGEWATKIENMRRAQLDQRMRKAQRHNYVDRKKVASGE